MKLILTWFSSALLLYGLSGLSGFLHQQGKGESLSAAEAAETLTFVFGGTDKWSSVRGRASHGWWFRTSFISGESGGRLYSEQVLKAGWPFTVTRGFVRLKAGEPELEGVGMLSGQPGEDAARFWPLQPVWPGIVINSLVLVLLAFPWWYRRIV